MSASLRVDLVLYMDCRDSGVGQNTDRAGDINRAAIAGVSICDHRGVDNAANTPVDVGHIGQAHQPDIREPVRRGR